MKRKALLISCASAAIAAGVIAPQKAHAQAFQGSITSSTNASQTSVGTGTETITVTAPTATINWAPNEAGTGTIDFLPSGNVATFQGGAGVADYTVLNRVTPDGVRAIGLNGSVLSKLDGGATGGKVWFYSPNGIVVGSTAVFDVGGLLLTVNDPTSWSATANGFTGTFSAPENSLASVSIENGAVINALQQNSYVALIAPRVEQGGTVQVNGAAAYAAGEQVTMTMNQGLFDIQVDIGTTDGNGVVHDGATGGPASTGAADHHRVYMVAVPKNEALTMLLSGNVGFDATTAGVVNGEIILSAGSDVLEADGSLAFGASSGVQSDISIGSGLYLSHLTAEADGNIFAIADESNLAFSGDVVLESMDAQGDGRVHVGAINGGDVTVGGDLWIQSNYAGGVTEAVLYANSGGSVIVGGDARVVAQDDFGAIVDPVAAINADNGSILINGAAFLGTAEPPASFNEVPGDGEGGDINVLASNGGSITAGSLEAHADGLGQNDVFGSGFAGDGFGGDVHIVASSAGSINVNGALFATADGYGGAALDGSDFAGFGQGGNVRVAGDGGTVNITGQASLSANGQGGTYGGEGEPFQVFSGDGIGGWARFETTAPDSAITIGGDVVTNANGFGGNGQYGGAGFGGSAGMSAFAGTIDVTGAITLNANGVGGDSVVGFGGDGGLGQGGGAYIEALGTASITGGNAFLDVNGIGGDGGDGFTDGIEVFIAAGSGGTGHGGYYDGTLGSGGAFVLADAAGALVDFGNINLAAVGTGGIGGEGFTGQAGGAGGQAFGGTAQAGSFDPGQTGATAGSASFGNVNLDASAHGGDGGLGDEGNGGAANGAGGNATGGGSYTCGEAQNFCGGAFLNAKGTVEVGDVSMNTDGSGGNGATGGAALGGFAGIEVTAGSSLTGTAGLQMSARGIGGVGSSGDGGDAEGGWAELLTATGSVTSFAGALNLFSGVEGGDGTTAGGNATGGVALLSMDGGIVTAASMQVFANAVAGDGATGGNATGNDAVVQIGSGGGDLNVAGHTQIHAQALGGTGSANGGTGGAGGFAEGGNAIFEIAPELNVGAIVDVDMGDVTLLASVEGGAGGSDAVGGAGGSAEGGTTTITLANGTIDMGTVTTRTNAVGGAGGVGSSGTGGIGGNATGGTGTLTVGAPTTFTASSYSNTNSVTGGAGGTGTTRGNGGTGTGGTGLATIDGSATFTTTSPVAGIVVTSFGEGGAGGTGGSATGGTASVDVNGTLSSAGTIQVTGRSVGGLGTAGAGGNAQGGSATLTVLGQILDGAVLVATTTTGGNGSTAGGDAFGTGAQLLVTAGGDLNADSVTISTDSIGGQGVTAGGDASHDVEEMAYFQVDPNSSANVSGAVLVSANATAGNASGAAGIGGQATAGHSSIDVLDGASLTVGGSTGLQSKASGGTGAVGGNAFGGVAGLGIYGSGTADLQHVDLNVNGMGGLGTTAGGTGQSSIAVVLVEGSLETANLELRAYGIGGAGGDGVDGGDGGDGTAGDTTITVASGGSLDSTNIFSFARGFGGDGGDGTTGFGGDGGDATGGTSYLTVAAGGTLDAAGYHGSGNGPNGFDFDPQSQTFVSIGGNGGTGGSGSGLGGSGTSATGIGATIDGIATIAGDFIATTFARGGDGSIGGNAVAGDSTINIGGSLTVGGRLQASASAIGGNSNAGTGGSADAGEATITLNGTLNAGSVAVVTNAVGGNGTSGGGGADAGNSIFDVNGSATVASALLEAHGTGGNTTNGLGGEGRGGSAMMYVTAGGVGSFGDIEIGVDGFGGHSTNGQGGDAFAGSASLGSAGDLTATGEVFVSAEGEGGDGLTGGGAGHGNNAAIYSNDGGSIELGTSTNVEAEGTGGASTGIGSGTGGDGFGGYASLVANDDSSIIANNLTVNASGEGGSGFNGGDGYGGFGTSESFDGAYVEANGFDSVVTLTGVTSIESGGEGGSATGGTAGSGYGGTAELTSFSGLLEGANVTVEADGTTGDGGALSGDGEAGDVTVFAYGGAIDIDNLTLVANGFTEGGTIRINVDSFEFPGSFEAGTLTATANGGQFAGDVLVDVAAGSTADFGNATLTANGGLPLSGEDGIELDIVGDLTAANLQLTSSDDIQINTHFGGTITVAGTLAADSAGLITMSDNGYSGPINATVVDLDGANIAFQGVVNADDILFTVDGDYAISELPFASNSLSITAGGNIGAAETVSYATSLLLNAGLNLTTVDIFTGGDLALTAGGNIGTGNLNSGQSITMNATGNIVSGDLTAGGGVAAGADGDLTVGDVISGFVPQTDVIGQAVVASGENVLLSAGGNLIAQTITSAEGITLDAGGTLTATDLEAVAAIAATSVGAMQVGNASAGQSIALSGGDVVAGNLDAGTTASIDADGGFSVGDVSADAATFTAGGLADFQGVVGAATIAVTSGDINIADGGSVGVDGVTDLITFNAVSDGSEVILGGDGTEGAEGQYQLAEDGDIIASAVVFNAVAAEGAPAPNIRVLDAEIDGSQASDGGVASVTLNTDANVFVEGQVSYADAAATDRIGINAGETIQVITDTGGIVMTGSDGDVSGILELTAHDIWVADQATLDQIAADPTFAGAEDLLSVNNGAVNPAGSIQAGGLTVTMLGSSFLVQNTGTGTEPAGLTVGGEGLSIVNNGSDPATVIIYGRQQGADGSIVTGDAFFEEVEFTGSGGFTDGSNVNGCGVSGGCGPDIPEEPPFSGGVESILGPVGLMNDPKGLASGSDEFAGDTSEEATEEDEEEEGEEEGSGGVDAGSTLINTGPVSIDPPIDQPVTSGADVPTGTN